MAGIAAEDGSKVRIAFDAVHGALGVVPRTRTARALGVDQSEDRRILADACHRTSAPEVFAAGDAVTGLNQIALAMAQAEVAAMNVHNDLRREEGLRLAG